MPIMTHGINFLFQKYLSVKNIYELIISMSIYDNKFETEERFISDYYRFRPFYNTLAKY